jgi:hypothetical protein
MPTYTLSIEPISYSDSETGFELKNSHFSLLESSQREHDLDVLKAYLDVSYSPKPAGEVVVCEMPDDKKHARFKTYRLQQYLDLTLRPDDRLKGKVHFLKAEVIDSAHKPKGIEIEYLDERARPPVWKKSKFDKDLPGMPQQVRLIFGMQNPTPAFSYNIYIRDIDGVEEGIPCDPQASNEPPNA